MLELSDNEILEALSFSSPWETAGGAGPLATVVFLRGCILNSLGAVETQLNEIAIRASKIPAYHQLSERMPYKLNERIDFVEAYFSQGVLSRWKSQADSILAGFAKSKNLRDQLAHCHLSVLPLHRNAGWKNAWITVKTFNPKSSRMDYKNARIEGKVFLERAHEAKKLATNMNALFCDVREDLPELQI